MSNDEAARRLVEKLREQANAAPEGGHYEQDQALLAYAKETAPEFSDEIAKAWESLGGRWYA